MMSKSGIPVRLRHIEWADSVPVAVVSTIDEAHALRDHMEAYGVFFHSTGDPEHSVGMQWVVTENGHTHIELVAGAI